MKSITVFGSAMPLQGDAEYETAYNLGKLIAANGFDVVNGGYNGIMEAVSRGAIENGGTATGITVGLFNKKPNEFLTKIVTCDNLFERINKLIDLGDAYVVLQGGTGTMLEFAAVWEYLNKGIVERKPIVCYSPMWEGVGEIINEQLKKEGKSTNLVSFFDDVEKMVEFIVSKLR